MDLSHIKEDMIDTGFWTGFAGSNGLVLLQAVHLVDVNEWLHFGVLTVTLGLGILKMHSHFKNKKKDG